MKIFLDSLYDPATRALEKQLDLNWRRNEAITSNIANAETPGYRAVDLDFAGELDAVLGRSTGSLITTNQKHMDLGGVARARLVSDNSGETKPDGNNVDIDIQMGQMALNKGHYSRAAEMLRRKLRMLSDSLREGM